MFNASTLNNNIYTKIIEKSISNIIKNIYIQIKGANQNKSNKIIYESPYYFEDLFDIIEKDIIDIDDIRIIIWGGVVENFKNNGFECTIDIQETNEKCYVFIKWVTTLDKYVDQIDKYKNMLSNCTSK